MACCTGPAAASAFFISHRSLYPRRVRRSWGRVSACIPDPTFNLNSPLVKKLSHAIASNPEEALKQSRYDKRPPLLHLLNSREAEKAEEATKAEEAKKAEEAEEAARQKRIRKFMKNSPLYFEVDEFEEDDEDLPDMPSIFLDNFIILIDYPLVSVIAELIIGQLLYLNNRDPDHPIYLYINSTGTSREDGEKVAFEDDGFGIYDFMSSVFNEIRTVVMGEAIGTACLLATAGKKGWRYMFPSSIVRLEEPVLFATGLLPEVEVDIKARAAMWERDRSVNLFCRHTGQSRETILNLMREKRSMWPKEAIEFGLVDKVLLREGQDKDPMAQLPPRRAVGKRRRAKRKTVKRIKSYGEGVRGLG